MRSIQILVLLFALFATQINSFVPIKPLRPQPRALITPIKPRLVHPNPRALIDDAQSLLDTLSQSVLGNILAAHDQIDNLRLDLTTHRIDVRLTTEVDLQEGTVTNQQQVANLKEIALSAEADITSCLDGNEDKLNGLGDTYVTQVAGCITNTTDDSDSILDGATYRIDVTISRVNLLNYALGQCANSDNACINQVITDATAASDDLPLQIKTEVSNASDDLDTVKVKIQDCSDAAVTGFVSEASDILDTITQCVNRAVG